MSVRKQKLADEIRDLLSALLSGGQMSDPRLSHVAITAVKVSPDLQIATVYFRVFGSVPADQVAAGLEHASGFLRKELAEKIEIRRVPKLRFFFDETPERAARIEDLLNKIRESS